MTTSYNPFSLLGKTILITGASSGIGKSTAIECSKAGATVIISGRNEINLNKTFYELEGEGHKIIKGDLSKEEDILNLISQIPKIDGIVMAAGIVEMAPTLFATTKKFEKIYKTNLFGPIEFLRLIIKNKLYKPNFSAVAISSVSSFTVTTANGIYGSGKAALSVFMKHMALELAPKNIRINTISPGMILTPMHTEGVVEEEQLKKAISHVPLKRWGSPEEIAYGAIYLLSDAASYVTGTDICIDGGQTI